MSSATRPLPDDHNAAALGSGPTLTRWEPENETFWATQGKRIATINLVISVGCLLQAFAIWMSWSIITVQMKELGFPFTAEQLFTLTSIAGLAGATLRIPQSFLVALAGGRNTVMTSTALLLVPTVLGGYYLRDPQTSFAVFAVLAALAGVGGGNFASSMSNISQFYPKKVQGTSLGINAGVGNLGVSVMQFLTPVTMSVAIFGSITGSALLHPSKAGVQVYIQHAGWMWVPVLIAFTVASFLKMNNLPLSPVPPTAKAVGIVLIFHVIGFAATGLGVYLMIGQGVSMWIVLPLVILVTLGLLKLYPGEVQKKLNTQFLIFRDKHTWIMTWLYVMTFGSFIGYSAALPLLIKVIFGAFPDGTPNPAAPNPFTYAWLGPLVGSLIRPVGGWLSDKLSGAKVTQISTVVMVFAALGVAWCVIQARGAADPTTFFPMFLGLFLLLFVMTGVGNGSTFRMIPIIFEPSKAGPVLGWTSAIAAYGSFIIPRLFGAQVKAGHPEYALYGFAVYYVSCLVLNWWFYARRNAEIPC